MWENDIDSVELNYYVLIEHMSVYIKYCYFTFFYLFLQASLSPTVYKDKSNCTWVLNYSHYQSSGFTLFKAFVTFLVTNVFY